MKNKKKIENHTAAEAKESSKQILFILKRDSMTDSPILYVGLQFVELVRSVRLSSHANHGEKVNIDHFRATSPATSLFLRSYKT